MTNLARIVYILLILSTTLAACLNSQSSEIQAPEDQNPNSSSSTPTDTLAIVWEALEPNTSSHDRSNWQVIDAYLTKGGDVAEHFVGEPAPGCWMGPEPPDNENVDVAHEYWFVFMKPVPATPMGSQGSSSPTAPPMIPEPFLREAYFLVDPVRMEISARKLICVIY